MWFSSASIFTVRSFGAGPGLYFDFALFIFHVPDCSSAAAMETYAANATNSMTTIAKKKDLVRIIAPPRWGKVGLDWAKCPDIFLSRLPGSAPIHSSLNLLAPDMTTSLGLALDYPHRAST